MQAFEHDVIYEYISRRHNLTVKMSPVPNFSLCLPLSPRGLQKQNLCRSNLRFLSFIFVPLYWWYTRSFISYFRFNCFKQNLRIVNDGIL